MIKRIIIFLSTIIIYSQFTLSNGNPLFNGKWVLIKEKVQILIFMAHYL